MFDINNRKPFLIKIKMVFAGALLFLLYIIFYYVGNNFYTRRGSMKKLLLGMLVCAAGVALPNNVNGLKTAVAAHDVAALQALLADSDTTVDATFSATLNDNLSHSNLNALSYACYFGHSKMATLILQALEARVASEDLTTEEFSDAVNLEDNYGWTAYLFAVRHNLTVLMGLLETAGATTSSSEYNRTRLMVGAVNYHKSHADFVDWLANDATLLEQTNEATKTVSEESTGTGRNVLMMAIHANPLIVPSIVDQAVADDTLEDLLDETDHHGKSALMYACEFQTAQTAVTGGTLLEILLDAYAETDLHILDLQDDAGMTALMYAAQNNDVATIADLLTAGSNALLLNDANQLAVQLATTDAAKRALVAPVDSGSGKNVLIIAAQIEDEEDSLAAVNAVLAVTDADGDRIVDIDLIDSTGYSALLYAIEQQHHDVITALLQADVDLRVRTSAMIGETLYSYITPIMFAIIMAEDTANTAVRDGDNNLNAVDACLQLLITVNSSGTHLSEAVNVRGDNDDDTGRTALMLAVAYQNGPAVYQLVRLNSLDLDIVSTVSANGSTITNETALMYAIRLDRDLEENDNQDYYGIIAQLLSQNRFTKIDFFDGANQNGLNPLFYAVIYDNQVVIELLLQSGADLRKRLSGLLGDAGICSNVTPLILAVKLAASNVTIEGELDPVIELMLETNIANTHLSSALDLYDNSHGGSEDFNGVTALLYAIGAKNHPVVHALIEAGASLTTQSQLIETEDEVTTTLYTTLTPLMYAVIIADDSNDEDNAYAIAFEIIGHNDESGAENALNDEDLYTDFTALMFAIQNRNHYLTTALLNAGASLSTRFSGTLNIFGQDRLVTNITPLMYAILHATTSITSVWDDFEAEDLNTNDVVVNAILTNETALGNVASWINLQDGDQEEENGFTALMLAVLLQNGPTVYQLVNLSLETAPDVFYFPVNLDKEATVALPYDAEEPTTYYGVTALMLSVLQDNFVSSYAEAANNVDVFYIIRTIAAKDPSSIDEREGVYEEESLVQGTGFNALMFAIENQNAVAVAAIAAESTDYQMIFQVTYEQYEDISFENVTPLMHAIIISDDNDTAVYTGESYVAVDPVIGALVDAVNDTKDASYSMQITQNYDFQENSNYESIHGFTPLLLAVELSNGPAVQVLVNDGADITQQIVFTYIGHRNQPLEDCYLPSMTALRFAILLAGADDDEGYSNTARAQIPSFLIDSLVSQYEGVHPEFDRQETEIDEPNNVDGTGWTALMYAILMDNVTLVEELITAGSSRSASFNNVRGNIYQFEGFELFRRQSDITPFIFVSLTANDTDRTREIYRLIAGIPFGNQEGQVYDANVNEIIDHQDMQGRTASMYGAMTNSSAASYALDNLTYEYEDEGTFYALYSSEDLTDAYGHTSAYYSTHLGANYWDVINN